MKISGIGDRLKRVRAARSTESVTVRVLKYEPDGTAVVARMITLTGPRTSASQRKRKPLIDGAMTVEERVVRPASGPQSDDRETA